MKEAVTILQLEKEMKAGMIWMLLNLNGYDRLGLREFQSKWLDQSSGDKR